MARDYKNKYPKELVEKYVKESKTILEVCRKLGWKSKGGNYRTFYKYVHEYGLDISHFVGHRTNLGGVLTAKIKTKSDKYLTENSFKITPVKLLKKLISDGKKELKCECCGNTEWNGKPIPLEMHHINGNHFDNRIENLMVLCPNCHAQTDNYRGRNVKKEKTRYYCKICGKELCQKNKNDMCIKCYREYAREALSKCPSKEELENLYNQMKTCYAVSKYYGIAYQTAKDWLVKRNIIKE